MERQIYEGKYKLLQSLDSGLLVEQYKVPGHTAEGVDIIIKHIDGVTVKQERYEDFGRTVNPLAALTTEDLQYTGLMRITLYAQNDYALGNMERVILAEIGKK